jgi:hypothetical protein
VNTGVTTAAIPFGPDSVPSVTCSGVPCGAHQDLLSLYIHELAHALNLNTSNLRPLNSVTINSDFGLIGIPNGPLKGTLIPWTPAGGGHTFLKPSPTAVPLGTTPPGYNDSRLDSPNGDIATNAFFFYGAHRQLVSDIDAVVFASVSNFKRVNLLGSADSLTYVALPDFTDLALKQDGKSASVLTLNDAAAQAQNTNSKGDSVSVLRLTPDEAGHAGSTFLTKPFLFNGNTSFESEFGFKVGGVRGSTEEGADGFAFVVHGDSRGPNAIGSGGGGLGYDGISPSLAVEFDTFQNSFEQNGNHVAFVINGKSEEPLVSFVPGFLINDGQEHFAWVDYDSATNLLSLFLSDGNLKPNASVLTASIDLASLFGPDVFFGFTAGTGARFNYHDILEWNLVVSQVPEPGSLSLLLAGLLIGLGLVLPRRAARRL